MSIGVLSYLLLFIYDRSIAEIEDTQSKISVKERTLSVREFRSYRLMGTNICKIGMNYDSYPNTVRAEFSYRGCVLWPLFYSV